MFVEPYLATVTIFAGNFAPRGWMFCQGQLLAIAEYDALFALIGTTYGGDGQTTFGLPDTRSRIANHMGQGPGLSTYVLGQMAGTESVTLLSINLPAHNHTVVSLTGTPKASTNTTGGTPTPSNGVVPGSGAAVYSTNNDQLTMGPTVGLTTTPLAGGSQPVPTISPVLAMNYIIAVEGIFPSRN
jgi:microcystin-dependent protein